MYIQIIIGLFLILLAYLVSTCYIKPKRTHQFYVKHLKNAGYRVHEVPFKLFYHYIVDTIGNGKKIGDPLKKYKE